MSLAVMYAPVGLDSQPSEPPPAFPRLARDAKAETAPQRQPIEAPPVSEEVEEEDTERWDGMA
jgi:hypothetical protein